MQCCNSSLCPARAGQHRRRRRRQLARSQRTDAGSLVGGLARSQRTDAPTGSLPFRSLSSRRAVITYDCSYGVTTATQELTVPRRSLTRPISSARPGSGSSSRCSSSKAAQEGFEKGRWPTPERLNAKTTMVGTTQGTVGNCSKAGCSCRSRSGRLFRRSGGRSKSGTPMTYRHVGRPRGTSSPPRSEQLQKRLDMVRPLHCSGPRLGPPPVNTGRRHSNTTLCCRAAVADEQEWEAESSSSSDELPMTAADRGEPGARTPLSEQVSVPDRLNASGISAPRIWLAVIARICALAAQAVLARVP